MKKNVAMGAMLVCAAVVYVVAVASYFDDDQDSGAAPHTIDVTETPVFDFREGDFRSVYYDDNGIEKLVTHRGEEIRSAKLSPVRGKLGFYHDRRGEKDHTSQDVILSIMDVNTKHIVQVYEGNYKTSAWEWIDDGRVIVYRNCGSPCYAFTIISTEGEVLDGPRMLGLSYTLSPDRQWLLGSVDWAQTLGAVVMHIKTKEEFEFVQTGIPSHKYAEYAQSAWSADGRKLAVLNKRPADQHMEATVYDVANDFKILHRETVACEFIGDDLRCDVPLSPEQFLAAVLARAVIYPNFCSATLRKNFSYVRTR